MHIEYVAWTIMDVSFVIDTLPSTTLIEALDTLKQIKSVFVYSPSIDSITVLSEKPRAYLTHWCENDAVLMDKIHQTRDTFPPHNKVSGSFLFFQLFKILLKHLPKTMESKNMMLSFCRNHYRGNSTELANIKAFE